MTVVFTAIAAAAFLALIPSAVRPGASLTESIGAALLFTAVIIGASYLPGLTH